MTRVRGRVCEWPVDIHFISQRSLGTLRPVPVNLILPRLLDEAAQGLRGASGTAAGLRQGGRGLRLLPTASPAPRRAWPRWFVTVPVHGLSPCLSDSQTQGLTAWHSTLCSWAPMAR